MKSSDSAKQKAIAEYLAHGNVSRAATSAGVNRSTLHRWIQKEEPAVKAAKAAVADAIHTKLVSLLEMALARLGSSLEHEDLSSPQLAIIAGILADKVVRFAPRKPDGADDLGEIVVKVRRGGARAVSAGVVDEHGIVVARVDDAPENAA